MDNKKKITCKCCGKAFPVTAPDKQIISPGITVCCHCLSLITVEGEKFTDEEFIDLPTESRKQLKWLQKFYSDIDQTKEERTDALNDELKKHVDALLESWEEFPYKEVFETLYRFYIVTETQLPFEVAMALKMSMASLLHIGGSLESANSDVHNPKEKQS